MKKICKVLLVLLLILFLLIAGGYVYVISQISPVSKNSDNINSEEILRLEVPYGTSTYEISEKLESLKIIKNKKFFYYFSRYPKIFKLFFTGNSIPEKIDFKSGIYYVNPSMNYPQLIELLCSGQQEYIKVSIPEGLTISKIAKILDENKICNQNDFIDYCYSSIPLNKYKITGNSCEGFLFPDTYYLTSQMQASLVADLMINNFFEKIKTISNIESLSAKQLYDKIVLASIVEREYRIETEAPLIASVFVNRLNHNIGLYSCATVEYIITEINHKPHPERILLEDTRIDNPYNTYKWAGLPPGPISNPGLVAINAACNPPKTSYYFFQIEDPKIGKHVFSKNFDEHVNSHNLYTK